MAKPKRGSVVDSYQTVGVNCNKCGERLFRYKKKNGTKSNLVKCYVERICEDSAGLLAKYEQSEEEQGFLWHCPSCGTNFARSAKIHGRPALKLVGGKVRMTKN
jgi:ssDNA-binding Zn-finger/Zn-ribbon topoisomerase 1